MTITMNDRSITSVAQLTELIQLGNGVEFTGKDRTEVYAWIEEMLTRFRYRRESKKNKGIIKQYLMLMTGLRESRIDKLIRRKKETGVVRLMQRTQHTFPKIYTVSDIALLAEVDAAESFRNGNATRKTVRDMFFVYGDARFERLAALSTAHLYRLRGTQIYRSRTLRYDHTKPVAIPIGIRKKPEPFGRPGFIRVDSVHQGDQDKAKGVYHVNLVDEVTQWEVVACVEAISEYFLLPALEAAIVQFPFRILNFHSDNGSEYVNYTVARLLEKLRVEQTKSRSRQTNDNALVEGKNGAVIRRHMGYHHIPKKHAKAIDTFYRSFFNPYLNHHRACAFADEIIDAKGKVRKIYRTYLTPCEKLLSLPGCAMFLISGVTKEKLRTAMMAETHLAAAKRMQAEKYKLFKAMVR
jgi:hypothetical protein